MADKGVGSRLSALFLLVLLVISIGKSPTLLFLLSSLEWKD
jgi:hypothetical protein